MAQRVDARDEQDMRTGPPIKGPGTLPSPLRYPGGKLWLVDYIEQVLDYNNLHPYLFIKP